MDEAPDALGAVALNCTLEPAGETSSTDRMLATIIDELTRHGVTTTAVRLASNAVRLAASLRRAPYPRSG